MKTANVNEDADAFALASQAFAEAVSRVNQEVVVADEGVGPS